MTQKILKIQLSFLSFITLITTIGFYYQESLPDNLMVISSSSDRSTFFLYFFSSFVQLISYYSGPWLLLPFVVQALLHTFYLSSRDSFADFVIAPLGILFCCAGSYLFAPLLVGAGLYSALSNFGSIFVFLLFLFSGLFYCYAIWRGDFIDFAKSSLDKLLSLSLDAYKTEVFTKSRNSLGRNVSFLKMLIQSHLRGKSVSGEIVSEPHSRGDYESNNEDLSHCEVLHESATEKVEVIEVSAVSSELDESPIVNPKVEAVSKELVPVKQAVKPKTTKSSVTYSSADLLSFMSKRSANKRVIQPDNKYFEDIVSRIEEKLTEFKIEGQIINILKGPVVDTFELELGSGVRVSRINSISEDLSLTLFGAPIRIVYPMKGRTTVGIEVPRSPRDVIYLDEVLETELFKAANQRLPVAMGKNAFGDPVIVDLASMPHMLVAGATGAGKSVFINTMLVSLLVKRSPEAMKLILVDPKQLELALYSKLPHLLLPVITDARKASLAFMWAVQEMERRYSILTKFHVRNLDSYNEKLKSATPEMITSISEFFDDDNYKLPYIVIVVDEFADLILTKAGKEIENNICRLAAKARAAGIHLVVATQRPSVDVITGLIKSNFPTRLSFRVTSDMDSRTILNTIGAEKLLGKGDMLYKYGVDMDRLHSAYVDENEIEVLAAKLSEIPQEFSSKAVEFLENGGDLDNDPYAFGSHIPSVEGMIDGNDPLYDDAVRTVVEFRAASASMLQRRLKVGYNRAANLIEMMEERGVVGPAQGSKPRKILAAPHEAVRGE